MVALLHQSTRRSSVGVAVIPTDLLVSYLLEGFEGAVPRHAGVKHCQDLVFVLGSKGVLQNHGLWTVPATRSPRYGGEFSDVASQHQFNLKFTRAFRPTDKAAQAEHARERHSGSGSPLSSCRTSMYRFTRTLNYHKQMVLPF